MYNNIIFSVYVYSFIIFLFQPVFIILDLIKCIPYFYAGVFILSFTNPIRFKDFKQYLKTNKTIKNLEK